MMSIEPTVAHFKVLTVLVSTAESRKNIYSERNRKTEEMVSAYVLKYAENNTHRNAETKGTF